MNGRPPGTVRIVAGARRGRRLKVPSGAVRPTSEMVREAIFDALGPIGELTALDLFAGTGALGLEALSRGAANCLFIERESAVAVTLRENIAALDYGPVSSVLVADYQKALEMLVETGKAFDLLFIDPPYRILSEMEASLARLVPQVLSEHGVAVIESERSSDVSLGLTPVFIRAYGDTKITMVTRRRSIP